MPTSRPRHMLTETDEVRAALDSARRRWPDDPPARLLQRLITQGHAAIADRITQRRAALENTAGVASGLYGPDYLEKLREDWDED